MRKWWASLAAGAVGVTAALVAVPAAAGQTCDAGSTTRIVAAGPTPARVVVGTTVPRTVTLGAQVQDPCTASVSASVRVGEATLAEVMEPVGQIGNITAFDAGYEIDPAQLDNDDAGPWLAAVSARGTTPTGTEFAFQLVRATRLTTNARPETPAPGGRVAVEGRLTRASWDTGTYRGLPQAPVELQMRTAGTGYAPIATVNADRRGNLRTEVRTAARAGDQVCFRYRYPGSDTAAEVVSGGDCIRVR